MMPAAQLVFPQPTGPLSINRAHSLHWAARRRYTDPWRDLAHVYIRQLLAKAPPRPAPDPVNIRVELQFRGNRRRDPHNYTGTNVKAVVDGLVRGGLIPDDTPEWATIIEPTIVVQPDRAFPLLVVVHITPRS